MSKETGKIQTKDYWTIIAMFVCGHAAESIEPLDGNEGRSKILVYHFGEEAQEDYDKWMRGVSESPFDTLRLVQQASTQFKNNLHRYCR